MPLTLVEFFYISLQIIFKKKIKSFIGLSNLKHFLSKLVRASPLWLSAPQTFYSSWVSFKPWDCLGHSGLWVIFWGLSPALVSCATVGCPWLPTLLFCLYCPLIPVAPSSWPHLPPLVLQFLPALSSSEG